MYKYVHDPLSFRLSTWPWGGASYITTFNYRVHNILFKPLLDYLAEELDKSPTLKVRYTTFTLVNVYSAFTDMLYGSGPQPHPSVRRGPMTFTFAMSRRDATYSLPRHVIWNTGHTALWGPTLQYAHDYLTISVPINICMQCRLNNTLRRQMEWLYKIVGGWSKSKAMRRRTLSGLDTKMLRDRIFYKTIPKAMWNYPWEDWKYVREFWDRAPNILSLEVDQHFTEYFLDYLTKYFERVDDPTAKEAFKQIEHHVRAGVLDLVQDPEINSSTLWVAERIPPHILNDIAKGNPTNVEAIVKALCNGEYK